MTEATRTLPDTKPGLKRILSGWFGIAAVLGTMIGLGILRTPGEIATVVTDPWLFIALWVLGGLFVLMSAGVAAELVGISPRSGGMYILIRRAFGPFPGFVIGWIDWLSFGGSMALKAVVAVEYIALLYPMERTAITGLAILLTSVFALMQLRGVVFTSRFQQLASAGIAAVVIGFSLALLFGTSPLPPDPFTLDSSFGGWGMVAAAVIFTYDGWLSACYFGGEIKGGGRAVALSCIKGVLAVFILYVALMAALAFSVPLASLVGEELALAKALELAVSPTAATMVIVAAIFILVTHQNLNYLQGSRILYALSSDHLGIENAAKVGEKGNPVFAVILTWLVTVGLILVGGFEFLLHLCVFFFIILYVSLITGVIILRIKEPGSERPFRAWGHPFTTALCLVGWAAITVFQSMTALDTAIYAAVMIAVSAPVYLWLKRSRHLE